MQEERQILFELLKNEVTGKKSEWDALSEDTAERLLSLAEKHDLSFLVADGLLKSGGIDKNSPVLKEINNKIYKTIRRTEQFNHTLKTIKELFEGAHIRFVPLKGAIIRGYYPSELMRTSCDIDILVPQEDFERAIKLLGENGFKKLNVKKHHDVSLYYGITHLELHFSLFERVEDIDTLLLKAWDYVVPVTKYEYVETREYFIFHHIAHMKYHFIGGGCGIKPFLDLYVLRRHNFYDTDRLYELLDMTGLRRFYDSINATLSVWFEGATSDGLTQKIEDYILSGGAFGTLENKMAVQSYLRGSRAKNLWRSAFPKYELMLGAYPILKKHKILLPAFYVINIFKDAFGKDAKKNRTKLGVILNQKSSAINYAKDLLKDVGLEK